MEEGVQAPHVSVAVPKSNFEEMQNDIKTMKQQIQDLIDLPENTGLLEAIRSMEEDKTPLVDMFQILSLTRRIDGVETGMSKLASMMEDLARTTAGNGVSNRCSCKKFCWKVSNKSRMKNLRNRILVVRNGKECRSE